MHDDRTTREESNRAGSDWSPRGRLHIALTSASIPNAISADSSASCASTSRSRLLRRGTRSSHASSALFPPSIAADIEVPGRATGADLALCDPERLSQGAHVAPAWRKVPISDVRLCGRVQQSSTLDTRQRW